MGATLRLFIAFLVAGVALAGALYVHRYGHPFTYDCNSDFWGRCSGKTHPGWTDPIAIVIAFVGVGAAAALARSSFRR